MSAPARAVPLERTPAGTDPWYTPPITTVSLRWALLAMVVTTLPFLNDVPGWIPPVIAATMAWRYLAHVNRWPLPHVLLRMGWAVANFALVFLTFGTINGLEPGTSLLLLMSAMKLTESARARDLIVLVYMGFFNVVTHALFDQQIAATLYGALALVVVIAALLQVTRRTAPVKPRRALNRSGLLLAQALPLMLLMFVLFPRVPGPFWALPNSGKAVTGLGDSMEIGNIAELLQSGAPAFRARFDGPMPPAAQRYWRGPVFDRVVANGWSAFSALPEARFDITLGEPAYSYDLTLETSLRRWVFALDIPGDQRALPDGTKMNAHLQVLADKPIKERTRMRLRSYTDYSVDLAGAALSDGRYLDVSETDNPRTQAYARQLRAHFGADDRALIGAVLARFGEAPFAYTLRPPPLGNASSSDAFLFDTRRGFCEHYASSFALLMRYAGIPARIVTGYQGGELNPLGQHLTVRQSDAHAWTEVWLAEQGWVRIDPTAAVAPQRVERGIAGALADGERLRPLLLGTGPLLSRLRLGWDAANAAWNRHVLGYGRGAQRKLMRRLGLDQHSAATLVALMVAGGTLCLGALALWLSLTQKKRPRDPLIKGWHNVCRRLAAAGLPRAPHEAPLAYAQRVGRERPDLCAEVLRLAQQFARLRYGQGLHSGARNAWLRSVARFKPASGPGPAGSQR